MDTQKIRNRHTHMSTRAMVSHPFWNNPDFHVCDLGMTEDDVRSKENT